MKPNQESEVPVMGTDQERQSFTECFRHYAMATQDVNRRRVDWDSKDVLFRSYIPENSWPYRSMVFDPRIFTALYEKGARLLANKPEGRLIPRSGGDALGAKINNELLSFQWDDNVRANEQPMLAKWALMDLNARKYGAAFAYCPWKWQRQVLRERDPKSKKEKIIGKATTFFDGPDFMPWNNRDVLHNPSYSTIKNWIQLRSFLTLRELEDINDAARTTPTYKNLDILRDLLMKSDSGAGDSRAQNYYMKNLTIKGLTDFLGLDPYYKVIEVVTEYTPERWVTFAPKHGIILRDIPNPYKHQQIPVIMLKYYPIDEDIYGLSEIEPVEKLQKAINALVCQYLDAVNMSLYAPLKIRASAVQMHTLEFGPGKKWLMNDPSTDVVMHDQKPAGVGEFTSTYRFLVSALQEGLGESSEGISNLTPGGADKTATEVKANSAATNVRDNFNLIFLGEALKKQMMFWHKMNQQFLFSNQKDKHKVIEIVGKDALKFFQTQGLDASGLDDNAIEQLSDPSVAAAGVNPQDLMSPVYPVQVNGETLPKLTVDGGGQFGHLIIEPEDLEGDYDYIPDVGSMNSMAPEDEIKAKSDAISMLTGVDPKTGQPVGISAMIQQEGKKIKATELFVDYMEDIGFKDADQYIESNPSAGQELPGQDPSAINQGGINPQGAGGVNPGIMQQQGMAGSPQAMVGGQA